MRPCPECAEPVETNARLCPHCGAAMPLPDAPPAAPASLPVWPPPPSGYGPPTPEGPGPLLTRSVRGDVVLGFVAGLVLCLGLPLLSTYLLTYSYYFGLLWFGLLGPAILAFAFRHKLPSFARGAKYCAWTQGAILLGALALCFAQLTRTGL